LNFGARCLRAQIKQIIGTYYGVFKVIFQGLIMAYLWVILEQRKCPLGIFEVMDLKGQIWGP
jgi:hypothetical protein